MLRRSFRDMVYVRMDGNGVYSGVLFPDHESDLALTPWGLREVES